MNLLEQFILHWTRQFPRMPAANTRLLLAVSGGADSVVLTDLLEQAAFTYTIAHANFGLRGEESARDEQFVRELAKNYQRDILVKHFDTTAFAKEKGISIQEAARELRYSWFQEILAGWENEQRLSQQTKTGYYIVTAHHADDNIETVLMHFFRGTGIEGMTGIVPLRAEQQLIRPLLIFRKEELLEYARQKGLDFVEDSSNSSDKYTRNFFRNNLLPQLKNIFPQVEQNILHNIERFTGIATIYHQSIQLQLKKLVEKKGNECHIPLLKWKQQRALHTITWELVKPFGFTSAQVSEVIKLLDASTGSYIASATHRVIRNRNWMIISPLVPTAATYLVIERDTTQVSFSEGSLQIEVLDRHPGINPAVAEAWLDAKDIRFPLLLRKWKQGDYFYPLGMPKKKKLSRFLIDLKLSKTDKEKIWVIESDKKILWVVGHRIDHRFRITESTTAALHINYRK